MRSLQRLEAEMKLKPVFIEVQIVRVLELESATALPELIESGIRSQERTTRSSESAIFLT
jgi:hypothetical protein